MTLLATSATTATLRPSRRLPPVPDAALAVLGDDARQALRGVVPIRLDRALRRGSVALRDGANDDVVLLHRRRQLVEQRAHVEPDVTLRLRLDGAVQGDDPRRPRRPRRTSR